MIPFKSQLRALWKLRFQRILKLEKESFDFYQELLIKNQNLLEGTKAKEKLEILVRDEKRHVEVAKHLLHLMEREAKKTNEESKGNGKHWFQKKKE